MRILNKDQIRERQLSGGPKVHLPAFMGVKTRCGRLLAKSDITEDGVETTTCRRCKDLYDLQEE